MDSNPSHPTQEWYNNPNMKELEQGQMYAHIFRLKIKWTKEGEKI